MATSRAKDLTGKVIGRLTVIKRTETYFESEREAYWLCKCRCGNIVELKTRLIKMKNRRGCGNCRINERFEKASGAYWNMINRCTNPNHAQYENYGGRGITVCDSWKEDFFNFLEDMGQPVDKTLTLDRIDNELGYSKENCRWVSMTVQINNTRRAIKANSLFRQLTMLGVNT